MIVDLARIAKNIAEIVNNNICFFDYFKLIDDAHKIAVLKQEATFKRQEIYDRIAHEFITPIEREDIIVLSQLICGLIDSTGNTLDMLYNYNIKIIPASTKNISLNNLLICDSLLRLMQGLSGFRKPANLLKQISNINNFYKTENKMFNEAVKALHLNSKNTQELLIWTDMYKQMKESCFECVKIINEVERIIIKNT